MLNSVDSFNKNLYKDSIVYLTYPYIQSNWFYHFDGHIFLWNAMMLFLPAIEIWHKRLQLSRQQHDPSHGKSVLIDEQVTANAFWSQISLWMLTKFEDT